MFLESTFNRMCEIDAELCDAIRREVVIVEDVSEDESRAMLGSPARAVSLRGRRRHVLVNLAARLTVLNF